MKPREWYSERRDEIVAIIVIMLGLALTLLIVTIARAQNPHGIDFSWIETTPNVTFNLYCATTNNGQVKGNPTITGISASPYLWTGGTSGKTYYCRVTAVDGTLESGFSNQAIQTFPPAAPIGVKAVQQ